MSGRPRCTRFVHSLALNIHVSAPVVAVALLRYLIDVKDYSQIALVMFYSDEINQVQVGISLKLICTYFGSEHGTNTKQ